MSAALATLNNRRLMSAAVWLPQWGAWHADATLDEETTLTGAVTLRIADATYVGTILSGGAWHGRSLYRIVGGRGGWGNTIRREGYANDALVKASTVLRDAAALAGESLDETTLPTTRLAAAYTRKASMASDVLNLVAPRGWYVGEDGVTRIGRRATVTYTAPAPRISRDPARGQAVLAADAIATLVPGAVVDGLEVVDVLHESGKDGLRTTLWGQAQFSRRLEAMRTLVRQLDPQAAFRAPVEYRVVSLSGKRLNVQPVRASSGMPDLERVPMWPGVPGFRGEPALGSRCFVAFIEADPARPFVCGFEEPDGNGFEPDALVAECGDISLGDTSAAALAKASPITTLNTAIGTFATAVGTAVGGSVVAAATALNTAISIANPATPTSKVKGT